MKKKAIIGVLVASMFLSVYGCGEEQAKENYPVEIWTAAGTEKLMRDVDYASRHNEETLTIKAFKNEYESAQIMISSDGRYAYEATAAALINEKGDVLAADAFQLYHQKYLKLQQDEYF